MVQALSQVLSQLESIAPLRFAEEWDNVGLLLEPRRGGDQPVSRVLLTIELSEAVLEEAAKRRAELVVAYHPPIFRGLKRLNRDNAEQRVLLEAVARDLAVYSPHTALDAAPGGVNEWLARGVGDGKIAPLVPARAEPEYAGFGQGRRVQLQEPASLGALVERLRIHLGVSHLRVARSARHAGGELVREVAVCAGAGGGLFENLSGPDLYVTGEMRHHDVRQKVEEGASVILGDHTNTERGYLPELARRLSESSGGKIEVSVATADRDPLEVV